jgi:hypothetical protein
MLPAMFDVWMFAKRPNGSRVRGAGPARKPVVGESMDGPASPAADC